MNYYDELFDKIDHLLMDEEYEKAGALIDDELNIVYIPRDVEEKLQHFKQIVRLNTLKNHNLNDEQIEGYLSMDENHQLLAVDELGRKNLRDYQEMCRSYLLSEGYRNAKVLLIDSLIRQEINAVFTYSDNEKTVAFNPSHLIPIEKSEGFSAALKELQDIYLKEPSMLHMAQDLLFKECILSLPHLFDKEEGVLLAHKISRFIGDAFSADK